MRDIIVLSFNTPLCSRSLFLSLAPGIIKGSAMRKQETLSRNLLTDELIEAALDYAALGICEHHAEFDDGDSDTVEVRISRTTNIIQGVRCGRNDL